MAGSGGDSESLLVAGGRQAQPLGGAISARVTLTGACLVINQRLTGSRSHGDGNHEGAAESWKGKPWQRPCRGKWAMH